MPNEKSIIDYLLNSTADQQIAAKARTKNIVYQSRSRQGSNMQANLVGGPNARARDVNIIKSKVNSSGATEVEQKEQGNSCHFDDQLYL